jgi:transposase
MAYSIDLRKRCVEYYVDGKHTKAETAKVFQVSTATVSRWRAEFRDNGVWESTYKIGSRTPRKLKYEELNAYVNEHPDAFLYEIAAKFGVSGEGVRNALKRYKITLKKNLFLQRTQ